MKQDEAQAVILEAALKYTTLRDQVDRNKMPQRGVQNCQALFDAMISADKDLRDQVWRAQQAQDDGGEGGTPERARRTEPAREG